jgi:hypothetical protein
MNEKLIKQLQEGKIAVHNDGTLEELREVLKYAFPKDGWYVHGATKYYISSGGTQWIATDEANLPLCSVKEFLKFVLPERWCITRLLPQDEIKIVSDYINDRFDTLFVTNPSKDSKYYIDELNNTIDYGMCFESKTVEYKKPYSHYTEITFEQFKKYVLKEKTMENNIKVGTTFYHKDNKDLIYTISSFDGNNVEISWGNMGRLQYSLDSVLNNIKDRTWIITMEKKILYYIVQQEVWGINNTHWSKGAVMYSSNTESLPYFKKLGILDNKEWFEPVYEEEKFKVGDWVLLSNFANGYGSYSEQVNGKVLQITKISGDKVYFPKDRLGEVKTILENIKRKATEEEIKKAQSIEIGGYEVAFPLYKGGNICSINGVEYYRPEIVSLLNIMKKGQIKSLNVGCSGQYKVDLELLEKIIDKF